MEPALQILFSFQGDIRTSSRQKDDAFSFRRDVWEAAFAQNPSVAAVLSTLDASGERTEQIRRSDVHRIAGRSAISDEAWSRQVFVAALMWGYGGQIKRYRYLENIERALGALEPLDSVLMSVTGALDRGDIEAAYGAFLTTRGGPAIRGLGPAFFTKILYFAGAKRVPPGCAPPLILDALVARALSWLLGTFHLYVDLGTAGWSAYGKGFVRYVESMARWAEALGCLPEDLEYYLWAAARGHARKRHRKAELYVEAAKVYESLI